MLALTDVTYKYKGSLDPALSEFSLTLEKGALLGLLGVNGAGKSTLVSLLMGIDSPQQGRVLVDGRHASLGRQDISFVPQEYAFYEELSIQQNLEYFAAILYPHARSNRNAAIDRCVTQCHLAAIRHKRPTRCSGGEKRRLNLAIALLKIPDLLILDEPTANVDPQARAVIVDLVRQINQQGVTVIYTSHLLDEVQQLCSRIALIHKGRLLRFGSKESLLSRELSTLEVGVAELDLEHQAAIRAELGAAVRFSGSKCQVDLRAYEGSISDVLAALERITGSIVSVNTQTTSLEDYFLSLIQAESAA